MSLRDETSLLQNMVAHRQRGTRGDALGLRGEYRITPLCTFVETLIRDTMARARAAEAEAKKGDAT